MTKKLLLNSFTGTALYLINVVAVFIVSPVMIKSLGDRDYGLWELVISVVGYMGLLDLGIGAALVRFVSVAEAKGDRSDLQQTISTSFLFFLGIGLLALLLFLILGYVPQVIAGSESKQIDNLRTVFILLGVDASVLFPLQVFIASLMGVQRHYFINSMRGILSILRAGLTLFLLLRYPHKGLVILACLETIFTVAQFVLFAGAAHFERSLPPISLSAVALPKLKELATFGAKSASMLVASRLQNQSVPFIIANFIGLGQVVYFVIPSRLIDHAKGMSQALGLPLTPYFGTSIGRGEQKELLQSWLATSMSLQIVSLAAPVVIFFYGETFLSLWIGKTYATSGRWIIHFLLLGLVADAVASNAFRVLTALGQHGKSATIWLGLAVLSLPVGIIGGHFWGVAGVTLGTTVATVVGNLTTLWLACSGLKVSVGTYFRETLMRLLLPLGLLTGVLSFLKHFSATPDYTHLVIEVLFAGALYMLAVWRLTLNAEVKEKIYRRMLSSVSQT